MSRDVWIRSFVFSLPAVLAVMAMLAANGSAFSETLIPHGIEQLEDRPRAPVTSFFDERGQSTNVEAYKGKVIVLNLWATWCGVCVEEIPSLERLAAELPSNQFTVIAVAEDRGGIAVVKPFLTKVGADDLPVFFDPTGKLYRSFGVRGLPTTLIILPDGSVISRVEGAIQWDAREVVNYLKLLYKVNHL